MLSFSFWGGGGGSDDLTECHFFGKGQACQQGHLKMASWWDNHTPDHADLRGGGAWPCSRLRSRRPWRADP